MTETTNNSDNNAQEASFSFTETEKNTLAFWQEKNIFKKSLEKTKNGAPYIFYDGPPFATGLPHHGHLVASTLKDIVPRYFTMKGRYVERRFGWDCHGLPIEHEINKKLDMDALEAVSKLGIEGYNKECRGIVQKFTAEWEKTITRMGRWVDFKNDYKTMDTPFMESIWWVFKQLWDKDLIYKGTKVVPFSTSLNTVLSNFEAGENYKEVQDPAVTVLFRTLENKDTYYMAWTTTPWTLPSNLGLCMGADIDYVKVKHEKYGVHLILAEKRLEAFQKKHDLVVVEKYKGSELKGKKYEPLFPYFKDLESEGAFTIINDDYVTVDDGTGIVHIAPGFGEDDYRAMREAKITAFACPVDDSGKFKKEITDYKGMYVKDTDKLIIKALKERDQIFDHTTVVHQYPFCPRSDTPLIYKAIPSWYVKVESFKEDLIKNNQKINWVPSHIKNGRMGKWLEGARDWAISRNRIWGTPLPIWINDETDNMICIGSIEELENATGEKITDLHREYIDKLTFTKDGEAGTYKRISEVLDCWFESGSMPFAQLHYPFENKEVFEKGFPAEYIAEGLDQTRGWFYTLTILSTALYGKPAFKNVIVNGMVLAKDGKKMSKRLKNYTSPDILIEKHGADALRLYLINSGLVKAEEMRFTDNGLKDMVRRALLPWYNSFKFLHTYAKVDGWNTKDHYKESDNILDRWILSKLQTLIENVTKEMESYKLYNVVPSLFTFIDDLTNWYIRLNRRRFWGEGLDDNKCAAYSTLYTTINTISTLMAPFAPFLSEHIYLELGAFGDLPEESVHLCEYPLAQEKFMDKTLEDAVDRMQQVIILGRQKRNQAQVKVKTPLRSITIVHKDKNLLNEMAKLEDFMKIELNVKEIQYSQEESKYIKLYAKPNAPVLGKKLGKEFGKYRGLIQSLKSSELEKLEIENKIKLADKEFTANDILIFREAQKGTNALSNRLISIDMSCQLDDELMAEGLAREIVNRIQKTRKDMNFNVSDRIIASFVGSKELMSAAETHSDYICRETLCNKLESVDKLDTEKVFEYQIEKFSFKLKISRS